MYTSELYILEVNECSNCSLNATCEVVSGSRQCQCKAGFTGDGKTCKGKNIYLFVLPFRIF